MATLVERLVPAAARCVSTAIAGTALIAAATAWSAGRLDGPVDPLEPETVFIRLGGRDPRDDGLPGWERPLPWVDRETPERHVARVPCDEALVAAAAARVRSLERAWRWVEREAEATEPWTDPTLALPIRRHLREGLIGPEPVAAARAVIEDEWVLGVSERQLRQALRFESPRLQAWLLEGAPAPVATPGFRDRAWALLRRLERAPAVAQAPNLEEPVAADEPPVVRQSMGWCGCERPDAPSASPMCAGDESGPALAAARAWEVVAWEARRRERLLSELDRLLLTGAPIDPATWRARLAGPDPFLAARALRVLHGAVGGDRAQLGRDGRALGALVRITSGIRAEFDGSPSPIAFALAEVERRGGGP